MEDYNRLIVLGGGGAIVAIILVAILAGIVRRRRRARALQAPLPLIPFSHGRGIAGPSRPDGMLRREYAPPPDLSTAPTPEWSALVEERRPVAPRSSFAPRAAEVGPIPPDHSAANPLADTARPNELVAGAAVDGASMRYWRPADGTLQFLPGRLEVIAGRDAGQEIRFVRTPGPDGTRVTFGRADGAPYRHVQLREPTVSRTHARMTLENGTGSAGAPSAHANGSRWRLENLSATNPVVVNGRALATDGSADCSVSLGEGDRIEMGEVVFRFHEK